MHNRDPFSFQSRKCPSLGEKILNIIIKLADSYTHICTCYIIINFWIMDRILINQMSLITVIFEDVFLMELSNSARLSMQLHYSLHQYSLRYTNFLLHLTQSRPLFIRTPSGPRLKSKIAKSLLNPWSIVNSNF